MAATPEGRRSPSRFGAFMSPKVFTRAQEKEELSNLNDRLASYIDRMRFLEDANARLTAEVTTSKENVSREVQNVKALYDSELADARRLVDETTKDKAKLQLENNKLNGLLSDLRDRLDKETAARCAAEEQLKHVERRLHDKESHIAVISKERKELEKRVRDLEAQLKQLNEGLDHAKAECENEMLRRVDAENKLLSLQEALEFNEQVHRKELVEARSTAEQTKFTLQTDFPQQYDDLIRSKLEELRDEFEEEAELAKKELEEAYKGKFEDLKNSAGKDRSNVSRLISKNSELRTELDTLRADYGVLEARNGALQKRVTELESLRALDREDVRKQMQDKDDRIKQLEDDLDALSSEYEQLMGIKIALDVEIRAYRKLLEGEEERLNMTPSSAARVAQLTRGTKRSRTEFESSQASKSVISSSASGVIQISEVDPEGKFVKLYNSSTEEAALGGWAVARVADGGEIVEYKFTPKFVLKGDHTVAIWGHSTGVKPKPPSDLVLKSSDWGKGKDVVTSVLNPDGEVVAKMTESAAVLDDVAALPSRRARRARRTDAAVRDGCVIS